MMRNLRGRGYNSALDGGVVSGALNLPLRSPERPGVPSQALLLHALLAAVTVLAAMGVYLAAGVFVQMAVAPAHVGESVLVPGGTLRVDQVTLERMVPVQLDKFAGSGMSMSGMGMDMAPEGYRRFTVQFTVVGRENGGLRLSADDFRMSGEGMWEAGPLRDQLGDGLVPRGSALSGSLLFQVPERADGLVLRFRGGQQPIALELEQTTDSHDHAQRHEDGENDDDRHQ